MSNNLFNVPILKTNNAWVDYRKDYEGGYGWRGDRKLSDIKGIAVHHTVTNKTGNAKLDTDTIFKIHHDSNGWGGVGYNFLITSEIVGDYAKVAYVGDIGSIRAHTPNSKGILGIPAKQGNVYMIGIAFIAMNNVAGKEASPEQLRSAYFLINELIANEDQRKPLLKTWEQVVGHGACEVKPYTTWCPDGADGTIIIPKIKSYQPNYMNNESQELKDAKAWENAVKDKYNIDLMSVIDSTTPITREHLVMILYRFMNYLIATPADDKGTLTSEDAKTMMEDTKKQAVKDAKKAIKDAL